MDLKHLTRWCHASFALYLSGIVKAAGYPVLAEGLQDRPVGFDEASSRVEVRMNGPYTKRAPGTVNLWITGNVLVTSAMGGDSQNVYEHDDVLGLIHSALDSGFPVLRTGAANDDGSHIACLSPIGQVKVYHFGQLQSDTRLRQGMVTATFQQTL